MRSTRIRLIVAGLLALLSLLIAIPAAAHTGFESSDPADGTVVDAGLDLITIMFTNTAKPSGEGFVVLDPDLGVREPTTIDRPDVGVFVLGFDPAISPGDVGVRWTVQAPDTHPIDGTFQFTIRPAPVPTATQQADPGTDEPDDTAATSAAGTEDETTSEEAAAPSLGEFLDTEAGSTIGRRISDLGRLTAMGGMMISLGFIVFATLVMRGTCNELRNLLFWIRRASVAVVVGTILDCVGHVADVSGDGLGALFDPGAYADSLSATAWSAYLLRIASGVVVAMTAKVSMVHVHEARDVLASVSAAVPVGAGSVSVADHPDDTWADDDRAWDLDRHGLLPVAGFVAMLVSHTFDGHTVTEGNRILTGLASAVHVLAAAIWVGGVIALALIIRNRRRHRVRTQALVMVTRFSVLATIALVAVTVFGLYLTWVIAESPSDLWATPWGRLLLAKLTVVAVAAAFGAHNHHVIAPALEAAEEDGPTVERLRRTLVFEVAALSVVTVLTALLVRASSTI